VPAEKNASPGQMALDPVQVSATSHSPALARHVNDEGRKVSPGQVALDPEQVSATSHPPALGRHSTLDPRNTFVGQLTLDPVHVSATSQDPALARHSKPEGRRASVGHAGPEPGQNSATSQIPALARHSNVPGRNPSAGQTVLEPVQRSSRSQGPAAERQTVVEGAGPAGTHVGAVPLHSMRPSSHGFPVEHGVPGTQPVRHAPRPLQVPPAQLVPRGANPLDGHASASPAHTSATSQGPALARHVVPAATLPSGGHEGLSPSQVSASSQTSRAARQTVPRGIPSQGAATLQSTAHTFPAQQRSPSAQVLARSQRPATQRAVSHGPAAHVVASHATATHPVVPSAPGAPGSQRGSMPAVQRASFGACTQRPSSQRSTVQSISSLQSVAARQPLEPPSRTPASSEEAIRTQPVSGTQTSSAAHEPGSPAGRGSSRQTPARHRGATQAVRVVQSASAPQRASPHASRSSSEHAGSTQRPPMHSVSFGRSALPGHETPRQSRVRTTGTIKLPSRRTDTRRESTGAPPRTRVTVSVRRPDSSPENSATRRGEAKSSVPLADLDIVGPSSSRTSARSNSRPGTKSVRTSTARS
jgi:hypothetical protein